MKITSNQIAGLRLLSQQLVMSKFETLGQLVGYFGAMQAQDYAMAKWAIGVRLRTGEKTIDETIANAEIIRTHVFRGTWHFVAAEDIRWMLQVTAPHGKKAIMAMFKRFSLDEKAVLSLHKKIEKLLSGNNHLTREEIILEMDLTERIKAGLHPSWITISAELDGLLCNGSMREKQHTYALLEERLPITKAISREEALGKLAGVYFTSHGPATLQDFIWWTGLTITEAKLALELIKPVFESVKIDQQTYWLEKEVLDMQGDFKSIHFLPAFDEFLIGYTDRTASISKENQRQVFTNNGLFKPVIVVNGKVTGTWKRTFKKDGVLIEIQFFTSVEAKQKKEICRAAEEYGHYAGLKTIIS